MTAKEYKDLSVKEFTKAAEVYEDKGLQIKKTYSLCTEMSGICNFPIAASILYSA